MAKKQKQPEGEPVDPHSGMAHAAQDANQRKPLPMVEDDDEQSGIEDSAQDVSESPDPEDHGLVGGMEPPSAKLEHDGKVETETQAPNSGPGAGQDVPPTTGGNAGAQQHGEDAKYAVNGFGPQTRVIGNTLEPGSDAEIATREEGPMIALENAGNAAPTMVKSPKGSDGRDRVLLLGGTRYEHVSDLPDGTWVYRSMP